MERKTHQDSWRGQESVKERFEIRNERVLDYILGNYTLEQAIAEYETQRKPMSASAKENYSRLFKQIR